MRVDEFQWDEENEGHQTHGLTYEIAEEVRTGAPLFLRNKKNRTASHLMIGPRRSGEFWTVAILEVGDGMWRPITGFTSTKWQMDRYRVSIRKQR
jgi:hypothetical protein